MRMVVCLVLTVILMTAVAAHRVLHAQCAGINAAVKNGVVEKRAETGAGR